MDDDDDALDENFDRLTEAHNNMLRIIHKNKDRMPAEDYKEITDNIKEYSHLINDRKTVIVLSFCVIFIVGTLYCCIKEREILTHAIEKHCYAYDVIFTKTNTHTFIVVKVVTEQDKLDTWKFWCSNGDRVCLNYLNDIMNNKHSCKVSIYTSTGFRADDRLVRI
jgi:hypothetical protein